MARKLINSHGFDRELVKVLKGGFGAWQDAEYEIETGVQVAPRRIFVTSWAKVKKNSLNED